MAQIPIDFLGHELGRLVGDELALAQFLDTLSAGSGSRALAEALGAQAGLAGARARRADAMFGLLGLEAEQSASLRINSLADEYRGFGGRQPDPRTLDFFAVRTAVAAMRSICSSYESLLLLAERGGLHDALDVVEESLAGARAGAHELDLLSIKLVALLPPDAMLTTFRTAGARAGG